MDVKKHLIIEIKGDNWVDKTNDISSINLNANFYTVVFNNSLKQYRYHISKLLVLDEPIFIDLSAQVVRIKEELSKWDFALAFGSYLRLFSNMKVRLEKSDDVEFFPDVLEQINTKYIIKYYYELANQLGNSNDKSSYISAFYQEKLGFLQPESVANSFLTGDVNDFDNIKGTPLFPFGINPSQRDAVNTSLTSQVSLIQGPQEQEKHKQFLILLVI